MRNTALMCLLAVLVPLGGCASQGTGASSKEFQRLRASDLPIGDTACVDSGSIRNWKVIDPQHLIVYAARKKPYLIELTTSCVDLRTASTIAFSDTGIGSRVCGFSREFLIVPGLGGNERCRIAEIRELDAEKLEALLAVHSTR